MVQKILLPDSTLLVLSILKEILDGQLKMSQTSELKKKQNMHENRGKLLVTFFPNNVLK